MAEVPSVESAAARARWLAELADALEQALHVVNQLGVEQGRIEAIDVAARIEAARYEVQRLRRLRSSGGGEETGPEWMKNIPWRISA